MEVETTQYEFAHGKRPRGLGFWAFFFDGKTDIDSAFFTGRMTFSTACALARREAKLRGARKIEVGS